MTFPNAYAGVKKLFTANILQIIGVVLLIITAFAGIVGSWILDIFIDTDVAGIGGIAILALLLICYILYLVLLSHAKKALATA